MQSEGLCPIQKRRRRLRTTQSNPYLPVAPHHLPVAPHHLPVAPHHLPVAPHLLLDAPPAHKPGVRFYSDITYIPTQEGWHRPTGTRMAATLDGYSRKCAGWSAADNMETPLVLRAAERAFAQTHQTNQTPGDARIHHSDRGSRVPTGRVPVKPFVTA
jgi:transposase InsO family protein